MRYGELPVSQNPERDTSVFTLLLLQTDNTPPHLPVPNLPVFPSYFNTARGILPCITAGTDRAPRPKMSDTSIFHAERYRYDGRREAHWTKEEMRSHQSTTKKGRELHITRVTSVSLSILHRTHRWFCVTRVALLLLFLKLLLLSSLGLIS